MRPKPMVEIGGMPILWHIMKIYSAHGLNDFVICLRLQGPRDQGLLRELLPARQRRHLRPAGRTDGARCSNGVEPWTVTLVDTGEQTMTGGRIKRVAELRRRRDVLHDLRRLPSPTLDVDALLALPPRAGGAGDADRGAAAGPLRRDRARRGRDQDLDLRGEARGRRRLDQRRLLRARAQGAGLHRRRRHGLGARAARDAGPRGQPRRLQAPGLLAEHGQPARQDRAREPVGFRQPAWKIW